MRERGWRDEEFDFVLQFMRTILLKHGAALIYTSPGTPSLLQPLIYSMLALPSPHRNSSLKHNLIERDKVCVPPHWDSWGKIRVLREGFDVEGINVGWSADISPSTPDSAEPEGGAVEVYEDVIKDTGRNGTERLALLKGSSKALEVPPVDTQEYLAGQFEILEAKAAEDRSMRSSGGRGGSAKIVPGRDTEENPEKHLAEQVGPVQFNVGGIQVDAENMLDSLKVIQPHFEHLRMNFFTDLGISNARQSEHQVKNRARLRPRQFRRARARTRCSAHSSTR